MKQQARIAQRLRLIVVAGINGTNACAGLFASK